MPEQKQCSGQSLHAIKQKLLEALNLDKVPHTSTAGISRLREQWKAAFGETTPGLQKSTAPGMNTTSTVESSRNRDDTNATGMQCCQLTSQIFLKDLGWDSWIVYPDTFTYTHCAVCNPHHDVKGQLCQANNSPQPSTPTKCCQPTSLEIVPFFYLDELNTPVISSVALTNQCGCISGPDLQGTQN